MEWNHPRAEVIPFSMNTPLLPALGPPAMK